MPSESTAKRSQVGDGNQAVIHRLYERVYSKGELTRVDELVGSDFIGESTESFDVYVGPEGVKTHVIRLRSVFHGFAIEIDELHVAGDTFEVSWTARGTHERPFLGIDPTCNIGEAGEEPHGNRIAVEGTTTGTIRNGKIQESRMVWDREELRHQLGSVAEDADPETDAREPAARTAPLLEGETQ